IPETSEYFAVKPVIIFRKCGGTAVIRIRQVDPTLGYLLTHPRPEFLVEPVHGPSLWWVEWASGGLVIPRPEGPRAPNAIMGASDVPCANLWCIQKLIIGRLGIRESRGDLRLVHPARPEFDLATVSADDPHAADLPPDIRASLILVESVSQEDGHEEAIHRRTDHRLPEAGGRRHAGQGALPQARFQ